MKTFRRFARGAVTALALAGLVATARAGDVRTPNAFLDGATPTFVVGTRGDARSDRAIVAQARLMRELRFPVSPVVGDTAVAIDRGPAAWPAHAVLYGGRDVNAVVRALSAWLPFTVDAGRLEIAGHRYEGDEYRLLAFVPGRAATGDAPGWPDFLLYAGTGSPGIAEINAIRHGGDGFLVADRFGPLLRGEWADSAGVRLPRVTANARRVDWIATPLAGTHVIVHRVRGLAAGTRGAAQDSAVAWGVARAETALAAPFAKPLLVYVYPDRGSKRMLTGDGGDGRADVATRSLHVVAADSGLRELVTHEAVHVLATDVAGPAGSSAMGEGLAVWAADRHGGYTLKAWSAQLQPPPGGGLGLMGREFARLSPDVAYPLAGLFVKGAIDTVGLRAFLAHLYGADSREWAAACRAAGTTPAALDEAFRRQFWSHRSFGR